MQITNKYNLPEAIVSAIHAFQYNYTASKTGEEKFTVSELLKPAYQRYLQKKHFAQITEDASERIWALMGQAMHAVLNNQNVDNSLSEERLRAVIDNVIISGQIDMYKDGIIDDYKFCSTWKYIFHDYEEFEKQLNIYAYLCRTTGLPVNEIRAILVFNNWSLEEADRKSAYPQEPIKVIPLNLWDNETTLEFIRERITAHQHPHICNESERWSKQTKYAVMKNKNKSAKSLCNSLSEAEIYIENLNDTKNKYRIDIRPGVDKRCNKYCNVKNFCSYYLGKNKE